MDINLRNLKDFLSLYNKITEICFSRCVNNIFERNLDKQENTCVDNCVLKFAAFNHKIMSAYVEVQTEINENRVKEVEEAQRLQEEEKQKQQQEALSNKTSTPAAANNGGVQKTYA